MPGVDGPPSGEGTPLLPTILKPKTRGSMVISKKTASRPILAALVGLLVVSVVLSALLPPSVADETGPVMLEPVRRAGAGVLEPWRRAEAEAAATTQSGAVEAGAPFVAVGERDDDLQKNGACAQCAARKLVLTLDGVLTVV